MTPNAIDRIVVRFTVATGQAGRTGPGLSMLERYETLRAELGYAGRRLRRRIAWAIRRRAWRVIRWTFRFEGERELWRSN